MKKIILIYGFIMMFSFIHMTVLGEEANVLEKILTQQEIEKIAQGIESESPIIRNPSVKALLNILLSSKDFLASTQVKRIIEEQFRKDMNKETILLAGLAEVDSLFEKIQYLATIPLQESEVGRFWGTAEWAATVVLARRGDKASIYKLLDFAESQDIHTQVVFISQDLQYVPRPEVVNYLRKFLESDERLEPFVPTLMGPPIANFAAASLARILKGFPVGFKEDYSYSKEEIDICRQWMSGQQEWRFQ